MRKRMDDSLEVSDASPLSSSMSSWACASTSVQKSKEEKTEEEWRRRKRDRRCQVCHILLHSSVTHP